MIADNRRAEELPAIVPPIVFLLGAGASIDYKYPTGPELIGSLIEEMQDINRPFVKSLGQLSKFDNVDIPESLIEEFCYQLSHCKQNTVDEFLNDNSKFRQLGAYAIALFCIKKEDQNKPGSKDGWYPFLFDLIKPNDNAFSHDISGIFTFNYDRSLEQYFYKTIKNSYTDNYENAIAKFESIPYYHLNGTVGEIKERPYQSTEDLNIIKQAGDSLLFIFDQGLGESKEYHEAAKIIAKAQTIFILGFGYHEELLYKLSFPQNFKGKNIFGLTYADEDRSKFLNLFKDEKAHHSELEESIENFLRFCYAGKIL